MNGKSSALLGLLIGLVLAAGLFLPSPDRPTLVAQGLGTLLQEHVSLAEGATAAREEAARTGAALDPRWDDPDTAFFAAIDRAAGPDVEEVLMTARVLVDGQL